MKRIIAKKNIRVWKNNQKEKILFSFFLFISTISITSAEPNFSNAVDKVIAYTQQTVYLLIGITMAFFFWGVVVMISAGDNSAVKEKAKMRLGWGVIILLVLFSVWAILAFMQNTTNLSNTKPDDIGDISGIPDSL